MANPAERLLRILPRDKDFKNDKNCKEVWCAVLDIPIQDEALLMSRLGKVMSLPIEIKEIVERRFPEQDNTNDYWISRISTAFKQQNLDQNLETFNKYVDQHTISYLRLSSRLLAAIWNGKEIETRELEKINHYGLEVHSMDCD